MMYKTMLKGAAIAAMFLFGGCGENSDQLKVDTSRLSQTALEGKRVFEHKNCEKCHVLGKRNKTLIDKVKEVVAPDLTNPLIANDSTYVRVHFKLLDESEMPRIKMSDEELGSVSAFLEEVHAAAKATVSALESDAECYVCKAPVKQSQAREEGWWLSYLTNEYFFECDDCKSIFIKAPEAFLH